MSLIGTGSPIGRPRGVSTNYDAVDNKDEPILEEMRTRFEYARNENQENRENYTKNVRISSSADQWDDEVKKRRGSNRPALTFNLLNLIVKQIIGDYRQNKLAIKVIPSGNGATEETADILAGIIRNIEIESHADHAYTNALECAARGGFGYFRILTEYEGDDTFNQKLVIKPIHNPLTVYCDPHAKLITRKDAEWYLVTEMLSKPEFKRQFPKAEENGWDIVDVDSDDSGDWGDDKHIRVCEYFTKKLVEARLVAFDNGATVQIDDDNEIIALEQIGWKAVKERVANRINIQWRKATASAIIEERTFKTKYIPIIPVLGEEVNIEGKTHLRGSIYYAIDGQMSYNYERSAAIERSALSAKAPWKATLKEIEMYRDQWDNANTQPAPYLLFTPDPTHNNGAGPERIEPPSPSAADAQNSQAAALDIQRTTGVFDSQLGQKSNVVSGVGLQEQQSQGSTSNYIYVDNLRAAIEYAGDVLIDWIPSVIDKEQVVRVVGLEGDASTETVNQQQTNPILGITEVLNDITVGKYDVVVEAGPAFASRRREAVDGMMKFMQAMPQLGTLIADLAVKNMDWPGADEIAQRLKNALPPQITTDPDSPEGQQAKLQAQQQQAQQQNTQQQLIQSKIQVEQGKNQASLAKAGADVQRANAEVAKAKADTVIAAIDTHQKSMEHAAAMVAPMEGAAMGAESQPAKTISQPQVAQNAPLSPQEPQPVQPQVILGRLPNEIEENKQRDHNIGLLKHGLGAVAQHMAQQHDMNTQQTGKLHELLGHLVKNHEQVAQAIERQNQIAAAPTEAVRDNKGKVIGSRKVI